MQAIILGAGIGRRLRPLTNDLPKCMVAVNGTPILVNTLNILSDLGVREAILVVGHRKESITEVIGPTHRGVKITYVVNEDYETTNNIYSLWLAAPLITDNLLLIEGDVFFERALVELALESPEANAVLVDAYRPWMDGTLVEVAEDGSIARLIPKSEQGGDFDFSGKYKTVNVYHFTADFFRNAFVPNLDTYIRTQSVTEYYELVLRVIAFIGRPKLHAKIVQNVKWYEIDDQNDLEKAEYMFSPRDTQRRLAEARHGGYWRFDFLDFCYLYNPYFPTESLAAEMRLVLPDLVRNYPSDQAALTRQTARLLNVPPQDLAVGNGASELIRLMNQLLVRRMCVPVPTFDEYENTLHPDQVHHLPLIEEAFRLDPEKLVRAVRDADCNAAVLVNPNNPTSACAARDEVLSVLEELRDIDLVVLDESFVDFADAPAAVSVHDDYNRFENLVVVKSLSKAYGVPGLRLGYALSANQARMEALRAALPIWNVNSLAEWFLETVHKHQDDFASACRQVKEDRAQLQQQLCELGGLRLYPAQGNFVFAEILAEISSTQLRDNLFARHGMLIKDCATKRGLSAPRYVRLGLRSQADNARLVGALANELEIY